MAVRQATASGFQPISSMLRRVGLGLLVALLIFGAGLAVGVRGGGDDQGGEPHDPGTTAARPGPGPTRVISGVPLGYARTEAGALAAAAEFLKVSGGSLVTNETRYAQALETMAAPEWEVRAARTAGNASDFFSERYGADGVMTTAVVAYDIVEVTPQTAAIELWSVTIASGDRRPAGEQLWGVTSMQLRWVEDDWRVSSEETSDAPTPALLPGQAAGDASEILNGFEIQ
jgi:hypothetical protein